MTPLPNFRVGLLFFVMGCVSLALFLDLSNFSHPDRGVSAPGAVFKHNWLCSQLFSLSFPLFSIFCKLSVCALIESSRTAEPSSHFHQSKTLFPNPGDH
jgi:hypothetical protein